MLQDINSLKEVARSIMPYGANRVAVKAINHIIVPNDLRNPVTGVGLAYSYELPKREGLLYYPLTPFFHAVSNNPNNDFETFIYAPTTGLASNPVPAIPFDLGVETLKYAVTYQGPERVYSILKASPRFVESITFKRTFTSGTGVLGLGSYPILQFTVY